MTGIKNVISAAPDLNKVNKQNDVKKADNTQKGMKPGAAASSSSVQNDQVNISSAAQELLTKKTEASKFVEDVKSAKTLEEKEIQELKQKIRDKGYLSEEIINSIADKLINLPNYFNK